MRRTKLVATVLVGMLALSSFQPCVLAAEAGTDVEGISVATETDSTEIDETDDVDEIDDIEETSEEDTDEVIDEVVDDTMSAEPDVVKYTVAFDGNGATSGTMSSIKCEYGKVYTLPGRTFKRKGYTFTGWNTKKDGSGDAYANKDEIANLSSKSGATVKLYAQWALTFYSITYVKAHTNKENPVKYTVKTADITLKTPKWTGHTFNGWYTDEALTKKATKILTGSTGDRTYYAKWTTNKYRVKYVGNGATSGTMKDITCKYGATYSVKSNAYKRTGYTFTGWNTKKDGSGKAYKAGTEFKNLRANDGSVACFYAQWKVHKYTVKFNPNGGTGAMSSKVYKYDTTYTLPANTFKRSGYAFAGWTTKQSGSGTLYKNKSQVSKLRQTDGDSVTFYAQWKPTKASISEVSKVRCTINAIDIKPQKCDGYQIYRSTSPSGTYSLLATTTSTSYSDTTAKPGITYYYKVRAYLLNGANQKMCGSFSDVKSIKTAMEPQIKAAFEASTSSASTFTDIYIDNCGTLPVEIGMPSKVVSITPAEGASSVSGSIVTSTGVGPGVTSTIDVRTDEAVSYDSSAYILFYMRYDGCNYIVKVDRYGKGSFM